MVSIEGAPLRVCLSRLLTALVKCSAIVVCVWCEEPHESCHAGRPHGSRHFRASRARAVRAFSITLTLFKPSSVNGLGRTLTLFFSLFYFQSR